LATYEYNGKTFEAPDDMAPEDVVKLISGDTNSQTVANAPEDKTEVSAGIDPADLYHDKGWLAATAKTFSYFEGREWNPKTDGDDSYLATYGLDRMRWLNNLPGLTVDAAKVTMMPDDAKQAFGYLLENYENVNTSAEGVAKTALYMGLDPTNWLGLVTGGAGAAAGGATKLLSKQALKEMLKVGIHTGIENAATSLASDSLEQKMKIDTGVQDEFSGTELALAGGIGAVAGGVLGAGMSAVGTALRKPATEALEGAVAPEASRVAAQAVPAAGGDARAVADVAKIREETLPSPTAAQAVPEGVPAPEPTVHAPGDPVPSADAIVTKAEPTAVGEAPKLVETPKLVEPGKADAPEVKPAVAPDAPPEAHKIIAAIQKYTDGTGFRIFNRTKGDYDAATKEAVDLIRKLKTPKDMSHVIDAVLHADVKGEQTSAIKYAISQAYDKVFREVNELSNAINIVTDPAQKAELMAQRAELNSVRRALKPSDLWTSSDSGAVLASRRNLINTNGNRDVDVETFLQKRGLDPTVYGPGTDEYVRAESEMYQWMKTAEAKITASADIQRLNRAMQAAYDTGDRLAAQKLSAERAAKIAAIAEQEPDEALRTAYQSFNKGMKYITEWAIGQGAFSVKTIIVNTIPHVLNMTVKPGLDAVWRGADYGAWKQMVHTYAAMYGHMDLSWKAAKAAFALERSMMKGFADDEGSKFLENGGDIAWKGSFGKFVRFFPRFIGAMDEFASNMQYRGYISGEAAMQAVRQAEAMGKKGAYRDAMVKQAVRDATEHSWANPNAESVFTFLRQRGADYGYTGDKLEQWVSVQIAKHGDFMKTAVSQTGRDYTDDLAFKRAFSGKGALGMSQFASGYEKFVNDNPIMRFMGQLFFRTPIRVVEAAMRLTAGVNLVSPNFMRDLTGKGPGGAGGYAQIRAQGELVLSQAIAAFTMHQWATGAITSAGPDNWKTKRTVNNDPDWSSNVFRTDGGSEIGFRNLAPYAFPMRVITSALDRTMILHMRKRQGEFVDDKLAEAAAYAQAGALAIAQSIREENLFEGLNQIYEAGQSAIEPEDRMQAMEKLLAGKVQLAIPQQPAKIVQAFQDQRPLTDALTVQQQFMAKAFPQSEMVPKRYDALGYAQHNANDPVIALFGFDYASKASRDTNYVDQKHEYVDRELAKVAGALDVSFEAPYDAGSFGSDPAWKGIDLRRKTFANGESWYDRLQKYVAQSGAKDKLYEFMQNGLPVGSYSADGPEVQMIKEVLKGYRQMAFERLRDELPAITDQTIKFNNQIGDVQMGAKDSPFRPFK
jgi:hypothetical protein